MKLEIVKGALGMEGKLYLFKTRKKGILKVLSDKTRQKKLKLESIQSWELKEQRSAGKSAIGAVGGGLLAGPVGLILGAAIGAKKKEVSTATLLFEGGVEVVVRLTGKDYQELESWI